MLRISKSLIYMTAELTCSLIDTLCCTCGSYICSPIAVGVCRINVIIKVLISAILTSVSCITVLCTCGSNYLNIIGVNVVIACRSLFDKRTCAALSVFFTVGCASALNGHYPLVAVYSIKDQPVMTLSAYNLVSVRITTLSTVMCCVTLFSTCGLRNYVINCVICMSGLKLTDFLISTANITFSSLFTPIGAVRFQCNSPFTHFVACFNNCYLFLRTVFANFLYVTVFSTSFFNSFNYVELMRFSICRNECIAPALAALCTGMDCISLSIAARFNYSIFERVLVTNGLIITSNHEHSAKHQSCHKYYR